MVLVRSKTLDIATVRTRETLKILYDYGTFTVCNTLDIRRYRAWLRKRICLFFSFRFSTEVRSRNRCMKKGE